MTRVTPVDAAADVTVGPSRPQQPSGRPLVAVLLGDGSHPFDRLVSWVGDLVQHQHLDVFVQHGATALPASLRGASRLGADELDDLLDRAQAVVTHGGAAEILAGRTHGHHPVAVPRLPELGEHADDHQRRSVARFADRGLCLAASSRDSLGFEIDRVLAAVAPVEIPRTAGAVAVTPASIGGASWPL